MSDLNSKKREIRRKRIVGFTGIEDRHAKEKCKEPNESKTYTMKVNHDSALRVITQQLLPNRPLQLVYNFSRNSLSAKLVFIFKINI